MYRTFYRCGWSCSWQPSQHLSHPGSTDYANIEGMDIEQDNLCDAWWLTDIDEVCEAPWEQHQANTLYQDADTRL